MNKKKNLSHIEKKHFFFFKYEFLLYSKLNNSGQTLLFNFLIVLHGYNKIRVPGKVVHVKPVRKGRENVAKWHNINVYNKIRVPGKYRLNKK